MRDIDNSAGNEIATPPAADAGPVDAAALDGAVVAATSDDAAPDVAAIVAERDDLAGQVVTLTEERNTLAARVAELEAAASNAAAAAKAETRKRGTRKLRTAKPLEAKDQLALADLLELVCGRAGAAGEFEIVASDGKKEIAAFLPVVVTGDAWHGSRNGVRLTTAVHLKGPPIDQASPAISGFALFDGDGTQIGWARTATQVVVPNDQQMRFDALTFA